MRTFLVDRLIRFLVAVLGATLITFTLLRLSGDPATVLLPVFASPQDRQQLRVELGLNDPLPVQFAAYMSKVVRGDFGESWKYREPALRVVLDRFPATLALVGSSMVISVVMGMLLGVAASTRAGRARDAIIVTFALIARSVPTFWLGTLLILFFSVELNLLPTSGANGLESFVMPVLTISLFFIAEVAMVVRASMVDALSTDYVRAATAKGLPRRLVVFRHALRNSLNTLVSVVAVNFGALLGGTVIVENVFAWPGIGRLAVESVGNTDFPVLQAIVIVLAVMVAVVTATADVLYGVLDPRIRRAV